MGSPRIATHLRAWVRAAGSLPEAQLHEDGGVLWHTSPIAWPMFNGVIVGDGDPGPALADLVANDRPWFLWEFPDTPATAPEAAAARGADAFDKSPWMEARVADLPEPELPEGVTIEEVVDEDGYRLWAATMREIYGFPQQGEDAWAESGRLCGWTGLPWRQWIAYADGEPAGVTLLFCGGGVAGLFGVGAKPAFRRRGIGRLVTVLPLKASGEEVAGFFATPEGVPLYEGLGFVADGWVNRWLGGFTLPRP